MARKSGAGETASEVVQRQAKRLTRLRQLIGIKQSDAADAAGVTRDAWGRYERGASRVDIVALSQFAHAYEVPAGYVVTGCYDGLPAELLRDLIRAEAEAGEAAETDSAARPA